MSLRALLTSTCNNLGSQAATEFENFDTPDDGRKFTELYVVQRLAGDTVLGSAHVVVSTVQRLWMALTKRPVPSADSEDEALDRFLKMAHEAQSRPPMFREQIMPEGSVWEGRGWPELLNNDGAELEAAYTQLLEDLGSQRKGTTFRLIFNGARNRIHDPAKLKRLVKDLIDKENWSGQKTDIKGDAYGELLSRGAEDIKSGAGQYFTPRPLIQAIIDCVRPTPDDTITDPASGTGGFLLTAAEYILHEYGSRLTPEQRKHLSSGGIWGTELVRNTARLAAMNLFLHGIGQSAGPSLIHDRDASSPRPPSARALSWPTRLSVRSRRSLFTATTAQPRVRRSPTSAVTSGSPRPTSSSTSSSTSPRCWRSTAGQRSSSRTTSSSRAERVRSSDAVF